LGAARKKTGKGGKRAKPAAEAVRTDEDLALERLREIDEVQSHSTIYQPLLQRMGYEQVTYCHGAFERGKDFLCLDRGRLGHLDLTVVQIKNRRIRGDTSSDSASEVLTQLERCLQTRVLNPLTHIEELPRRVLLFSSYPFPDHSVAGMSARLEALRRSCDMVEGVAIIGLLKHHLPEVYAELVHPGGGLTDAILRHLNLNQA
jgi:hypothetical protein